MSEENRAAWLPSPGGTIEVGPAPMWEPGPGQIRVKIINAPLTPADALFSSSAPPFPLTYPTVISSTMAGFVHSLGAGVTKVKIGDRVVSGTSIWTSRGDARFGGVQRFGIVEEREVVEIGQIPFPTAIATTIQTAAGALFSPLHLDLHSPDFEAFKLAKSKLTSTSSTTSTSEEPQKKKLLIYGGASTMGALLISHATHAGYSVITTCSSHNFEFVKSLGASQVFDYHDEESTIDVLRGIVERDEVGWVVDCVSLVSSLGVLLRVLQTVGDVKNDVGDGVVNENGKESKNWKIYTLTPTSMHRNGHPDTNPTSPSPPLPANITTEMILYRSAAPENAMLTEWMMQTDGYLERGLKGGWLRGVSGESVGGLGGVQAGLERRRIAHLGGVSARRLVVDCWAE